MKQKCKNCGMTSENEWCENPTKDYSCDYKNVPHVWENVMQNEVTDKICSHCKIAYNKDFFHNSKYTKDGKNGLVIRRVILESPFAGEVERNVKYARRAMRDSLLNGEAPFASHLLYTQDSVLDDNDPKQRMIGIEAGLAWGTMADATVVYIDYGISKGMEYGIERAKKEGRPVEIREIGKNDNK